MSAQVPKCACVEHVQCSEIVCWSVHRGRARACARARASLCAAQVPPDEPTRVGRGSSSVEPRSVGAASRAATHPPWSCSRPDLLLSPVCTVHGTRYSTVILSYKMNACLCVHVHVFGSTEGRLSRYTAQGKRQAWASGTVRGTRFALCQTVAAPAHSDMRPSHLMCLRVRVTCAHIVSCALTSHSQHNTHCMSTHARVHSPAHALSSTTTCGCRRHCSQSLGSGAGARDQC